jgi:Protein of unknown function (DUF2877)
VAGARTLTAARAPTVSRLAAASTVLAPLLEGPARAARVVGTLGTAMHIVADDERVPLVCLCTPEAIRLPPSLVLPGPLPAHLGRALVGNGGVMVGETWIGVGRWWRPLRPELEPGPETTRRTQLAFRFLQPLEPMVATAVPALAGWLAGRTMPGAVSALVGRGSGLTPAGDDLLCGVLVTLRAMRDPRADRLARAIGQVAATQTTHVSAALLVHASRGECVPELAGLIAALDGRGDVRASMQRLAVIGHSSGTSLAHGVLLAVATCTRAPG